MEREVAPFTIWEIYNLQLKRDRGGQKIKSLFCLLSFCLFCLFRFPGRAYLIVIYIILYLIVIRILIPEHPPHLISPKNMKKDKKTKDKKDKIDFFSN